MPTVDMVVQKIVSSANGFNTAQTIKNFAMLGYSKQIISNNAALCTSQMFGEFCIKHGIRQSRSAPYNPATNGKAERRVQGF